MLKNYSLSVLAWFLICGQQQIHNALALLAFEITLLCISDIFFFYISVNLLNGNNQRSHTLLLSIILLPPPYSLTSCCKGVCSARVCASNAQSKY